MADQKTTSQSTPNPAAGANVAMTEATRTKLNELHKRLLRLHKTLLDDERKQYELLHGPIESPNQVLSLVMHDPFFDWLHRISESIIRIDLVTEGKRQVGDSNLEEVSDLLTHLRQLFNANGDHEFMNRYKAAMRRDPAAVLAHMEVQKLLVPDA